MLKTLLLPKSFVYSFISNTFQKKKILFLLLDLLNIPNCMCLSLYLKMFIIALKMYLIPNKIC